MQTPTEQLTEWILKYNNDRDALIVALSTINVQSSQIRQFKEQLYILDERIRNLQETLYTLRLSQDEDDQDANVDQEMWGAI